MTDAEIIKALECCVFKKCGKCQMPEENTEASEYDCEDLLILKLRALINRQRAEIDQFANIGKMYSEIKTEAIREFAEKLKKAFASLERRPEIHRKTIEVERFTNIVNWVLHEVTTKEIDKVVKEMVGE